MQDLKVGILGATGAVGRQMLQLLEEYQISVGELRLFSGPHSAGTDLEYKNSPVRVEAADLSSFTGLDFVLGAADGEISRKYVSAIRASGAVYIDNSSAFRLRSDVPLVIPEINGADAFRHHGVIANPNCSTIITMMAVAGLHQISPIRSMVVSTYQAVSGAGLRGQKELLDQLTAHELGLPCRSEIFPAQIAMNVIPCIGARLGNGYTDEEMKMQNEGRRILHNPVLSVSCTCVRVPVLRSHAISVNLWTDKKIPIPEAEKALQSMPGVMLMRGLERDCPTPLDAEGQDMILVGRLREELTHPNGISLWCCGDQIRKGAATNAIQIMKLLR